jgi:hypothetical protein
MAIVGTLFGAFRTQSRLFARPSWLLGFACSTALLIELKKNLAIGMLTLLSLALIAED